MWCTAPLLQEGLSIMFALRFPFPTLLSYCMERPLKQKRLPVTRSSLHFDYLSKIFLTFSAQNYCKVESTQIWLICHYCIFCTTLCCFLNSHIASLIEITNTKKKHKKQQTTKNNFPTIRTSEAMSKLLLTATLFTSQLKYPSRFA